MTEVSKHIETFKALAKGTGWPTKVTITDTEWTIQADEPVEDGGNNSGPNPMQYFAVSLAACQNEQAQVVTEELSLSITELNIDLEIDLDLAGFMGMENHSNGSYKEVRLAATVKGDLTNEQVQELGKRVDARCPVLALLRSANCVIISSWGLNK